MPYLERERRIRRSYNFDLPVTFAVDAGGTRDPFSGQYTANFVTFMAWCRRQDTANGAGYYFDPSGAFRLSGDVAIETRFDPRIAAGSLNRFTVGPDTFTIQSVELVGRNRYMVIQGRGAVNLRWPWQRETRADSSYTDALVAAITANASGQNTAFPTATAALEACAGLVGRAFASASIQGAPDHVIEAIGPDLLNLAGRALIRRGEILLAIDVWDGDLRLRPVASHDIDGDYAQWVYRLKLAGPSEQITRSRVPSEGVCHVMYSADPETPWRGVGPLGVAQLAGRLSAETIAALADEASGPRGSFLPLPRTDGADSTIATLSSPLKKASLTGFHATAKHIAAKAVSPFSETMRTI